MNLTVDKAYEYYSALVKVVQNEKSYYTINRSANEDIETFLTKVLKN